MFSKTARSLFVMCFLLMLYVPLLKTNLKKDQVSVDEKRKLAPMAELYDEKGKINKNFTIDFENWLNDNIGFRSMMVVNNARIQYYLFNVLANNSDMYLGPEGELNYATAAMLKDYQHKNLYTEKRLKSTAEAFQYVCDYIKGSGARFFYYQCWDKHSIYPESFPDTVIQYGEQSKTDGIVDALEKNTSIRVISPKKDLIDAKNDYSVYSRWGDATHWSKRGAYIGYQCLMEAINEDSDIQYKILGEDDYDLSLTDQGQTLFGGIHQEDILETFELKEPKAKKTNEKLALYGDDNRHLFYTNEAADNRTRLLIIGDSYFNTFLVDDIAESFYETVMIRGDYFDDLENIINTYHADIVVYEEAERVDRTKQIIDWANRMKEKG